MISFHFIIQKELESSEDICDGSDMITSTNDSKSRQMIKHFKDLEMDEIIESFDVSDSVLNDLESSSNDQARPSRQHTLMTNGQKPRLSKNLKRKSKNSKQGRSQVLPFFYISGILVVISYGKETVTHTNLIPSFLVHRTSIAHLVGCIFGEYVSIKQGQR